MKADQSFIDQIEAIFQSSSRLTIPEYQRKYCWNSSKFENFLMNIFESFRDNNSVFLGSFIFQEDNGAKNVVDGQQRICSLLLLFIFIRVRVTKPIESLERIIFSPSSGKTSEKSLSVNFEKSLANSEFSKFLDCCVFSKKMDPEIFEKEISKLKIADNNLGKTISSAFNYFKNEIKQEQLKKFYEFLRNDLFANIIKEDDNSKALSIFEILNTQGEPLTAFEVLVPRIEFLIQKFKLPQAQKEEWEIIKNQYSHVPSSDREPVSSALVLSYLMLHKGKSSLGPTKQKEALYKALRDINSKEDLYQFINEFKAVSDFYFNVWRNQELSNKLKLDIAGINSLQFLVSLKHTIVIPVLCYSYSNKIKTFSKVLKSVASFSALWRTDSLGGTNSIDQKYRELISGDYYRELTNIKRFFRQCLRDEKITKNSLVNKVTSENLSAQKLSKFLIISATQGKIFRNGAWGIPARLPKEGGVYQLEYRHVTLEHICPRVPMGKKFAREIFETKKVESIGNFTLLPGVLNSSISNNDFPKKLQFYRNLVDAKRIDKKFLKNNSEKIIDQINFKAHNYLSDLSTFRKDNWSVKDVDKRARQIVSSACDTLFKEL